MRTVSLAAFFLLVLSCNNKQEKPGTAKTKNVYYPYSPYQTSNFEIGQPQHVKTVLDFWRAFDRGHLLYLKESFAPQVTIMLPDQYMQGIRDTVLTQWQKKREGYTTVQTMVDSWVPVQATDTKENFILVWARREMSLPDGKILHRTIHEKWRINQFGKIDFMQHYVNENY